MKILRFDLIAYGPFTGRSLDLSKGDHGFHLIYGPNEAGKSSALRALGDALYGVPPRTPDNFIHSYANLRVGAVLEERGRLVRFAAGREYKELGHAAIEEAVSASPAFAVGANGAGRVLVRGRRHLYCMGEGK
jgi:hypothetical protein